MTCDAFQRAISMDLDGEAVPEGLKSHLARCTECHDFRRLSEVAASSYFDRVKSSQRALRALEKPPLRRRRSFFVLATAAALLIATWAWWPAVPIEAPPLRRPVLTIGIPDLPASLRSEPELDLLAIARELPLRLGDAWPAEDVALPRSVAE